MTPPLRFCSLLATVAVCFVLVGAMALDRPAQAGTLQVSDREHLLSADDTGRLRSILAGTPFDGRFVATSAYVDPQELSRYVGSLVNEPNVVVVGLDPQHRHVQVHFGNGTRIPRSEWPAIERAGNDLFRRGAWADGAAAIFEAASHVAASAPVGDGLQVPAPAVAARPSFVAPALLLLVLAGGIGLAVMLARRRGAYGGAPGYGPTPYQGPLGGYPGQGYPPSQGGMGPLGGGLLGAGLGGLAGYELGKLEGERENRIDRDPGGERALPNDDPGGNYDAGGGGSGWDDGGGGGESGGFDGGGGGDGGGSDF